MLVNIRSWLLVKKIFVHFVPDAVVVADRSKIDMDIRSSSALKIYGMLQAMKLNHK